MSKKLRDVTNELRALQTSERSLLAAAVRYGKSIGMKGQGATRSAAELDAAARTYWAAIEDYRKNR
jgi:hypothetical protein